MITVRLEENGWTVRENGDFVFCGYESFRAVLEFWRHRQHGWVTNPNHSGHNGSIEDIKEAWRPQHAE